MNLKNDKKDLLKLESILKGAFDSIISINEQGVIESFNPAAEKMFGYTADEIIGKNVSILMPEPFSKNHHRYIQRYLSTGHAKVIGIGREVTAARKDTTTFPARLSIGEAILDGEPIFTGVLTDLTKEKEAEAALLKQTETIKAFSLHLENLHRISISKYKTYDELLDDFLKTGCQIFGLPIGMVGEVSNEIYTLRYIHSNLDLHRGMQFPVKDTYCSLVVNGLKTVALVDISSMTSMQEHSVFSQHQIDSFIGSPILVHGTLYGTINFSSVNTREPFRPDEYKIIEMMGLSIGRFLELNLAENNLVKAVKDLQLSQYIVEHSANPIYLTHPDASIFYINEAACHMLGYTKEELLQLISFDFSLDLNQEKLHFIWEAIRGDQTITIEGRHRAKSGQIFHVESVLNRIEYDGNEYSCEFVRDISYQKQFEMDLKKAKVIAEAANKTKSEFLANMSHEIRTPMNAVLGFTELLSSIIRDEKQISYIQSIRSASKNLLTLINDILDLSKIEAGKLDLNLEPVDIKLVCQEIHQIFELKINEKNLGFKVVLQNENPIVLIDETRLRQVLLNLVGNAIKFTHQGSVEIIVQFSNLNEVARTVDLIVQVKDTGIGISKEYLKEIFDSFSQVRHSKTRVYEGTGLGLAISKRLVEMMKGTIQVESEENVGSIFTLTFKQLILALDSPETLEFPVLDLDVIKFDPATILVVDDIESNRHLIFETLSRIGFKIMSAENGHAAIQCLESAKVDLILMDIKMPVMDGYQTFLEIKKRQQWSHIPIIALTASVVKEERKKIIDFGFNGYLDKPIQLNVLYNELIWFLPFTEEVVPEPQGPPEPKPVEQEHLLDIEGFIEELEYKSLSKWKDFSGVIENYKIQDFSNHLLLLAEKHNSNSLKTYAHQMLSLNDLMDFENLNRLIDQFPSMIESIRVQHQNHH